MYKVQLEPETVPVAHKWGFTVMCMQQLKTVTFVSQYFDFST